MDQIKKHGFWIAIGVAVAVLVGFFAFIVQGKLELGSAGKKLSSAVTNLTREDPPANSVLKDYDALKEKMIGSYGKITAFYAASDKHFERWFPGLPENPDRGSFQAKYDGQISELEKELLAKGTEVGLPDPQDPANRKYLGFSWEQPDVAQWGQINSGGPGEEQRVLKEIQKRFWIRQRVANIVLRGNVKVSAITHFRFFKMLTDKVQSPPWQAVGTGADVVLWPGVRTESGGGFSRNFAEFDLPNELGRTMTFGFALSLPYSEVPKVLKEILNPDIEPRGESGADRLLVNLLGAEVTALEQNEPVIDYTYFKGNAQQEAEEKAKAVARIKARNVRMAVTCQVIDFEPAKVAKLTAEPAAPAPAEEKPKP